jgi:hypothetical protein
MSANGCSTSTGNIANNEFGNKNISGSIILKSKNNSQKRSANTIIKAHDNVAENEGYKMILPSTKGTAEQVLKIDSVTDDLLNLSWGEGGGGGGGGSDITVQDEGSSLATAATTLNFTGENVTASGTGATKTINITSDTYSQYSLETTQFSLLSGLTFDSGGGGFSEFFSNSNANGEFVRFSLSSYPQSFTWTPHTNEVHYPLTKVVMWTRDTNAVNDIEMFPTQFKIYGRPNAGSSTGETEIGNIILSSQPSRSDNLLISSAAVNSVINTNKVVYSQYRIEIYENNSTNFSNKPLIGELRFYRPSSVQQYGNELTNWTENGAGHIIPSENSLYDIGSAEKKVRHLYLSSNSLFMGTGSEQGTAISLDEDGDLNIGNNKLLKITNTPQNGQGLIYNSNDSRWEPKINILQISHSQTDQVAVHTLNAGTSIFLDRLVPKFQIQITPSSSTNLVRIRATCNVSQANMNESSTEDPFLVYYLARVVDSTTTLLRSSIGASSKHNQLQMNNNQVTNLNRIHTHYIEYIDSPNTTLPVTYRVVVENITTSVEMGIAFNIDYTTDSNSNVENYGVSVITGEEILTINQPPHFVNALPSQVILNSNGTATDVNVTAADTDGSDSVTVSFSGTPTAGTTAEIVNNNTLRVTPSITTEGTFNLTVTATDSEGRSSSGSISFTLSLLPEAHILGYDSTKITDVSGSVNGIATLSASREDGSFTVTDTSMRSIFFDAVRNYTSYGITPYPYGILNSATVANPMNVYITWVSPQKVTHYHWRSRNYTANNWDARAPTTWEVQVFQGGAWTTIHTVTGDTRAKNQTYYWKIPDANQVSTSQYRWRITDTTYNTADNLLHISRMRIYSGLNDPSPNPNPTNFSGLSFV